MERPRLFTSQVRATTKRWIFERSLGLAFCVVLQLALLLTLSPLAHAGASSDRGDWVSRAFGADIAAPQAGGPVSTNDLLRLRDVDGLSLSPNGEWLAFFVRQGSVELNDYRIRWFVARTDGKGEPIVLKVDGGVPIVTYLSGLPVGYIRLDEPSKWSADSTKFAFRRRIGERVALLVVTVATGTVEQVYDGASQVTDFAWSGNTLIFRTGFDAARFQTASEREVRHGWLFDQRIILLAARTPSPLRPDCTVAPSATGCDVKTLVVGSSGAVRLASDAEARYLDDLLNPHPAVLASKPFSSVDLPSASPKGEWAWVEAVQALNARKIEAYDWCGSGCKQDAVGAPFRRVATNAGGEHLCESPECLGQRFESVGFARKGASIWFIKRVSKLGNEENGPLDQLAIYEWDPASSKVHLVSQGDEVLKECQAHDMILFCVSNAPTEPDRIIAINLSTNQTTAFADPNSFFASKEIPPVRKLLLRDSEGHGGFAYLVYPKGYQAGRRYPLVLVQYNARGFLRGGTGDDYPIFPIAAEGMFVLSMDRPGNLKEAATLTNHDINIKDRKDQWMFRSFASAMDKAMDGLITEGLVDRDRIAITGLSFGAEMVHYMLQHSDRFVAAIASQAATDVTYLALTPPGPTRRNWMELENSTTVLASPGSEIMKAAWSRQPEKLRTPLLLNISQNETMFGFEGIAVLQEENRPLEVRIFPNEGHIKYYPVNIAGIYDNDLMWLKFWLKGEEDSRPEFREQYTRWEAMRAQVDRERQHASDDKPVAH